MVKRAAPATIISTGARDGEQGHGIVESLEHALAGWREQYRVLVASLGNRRGHEQFVRHGRLDGIGDIKSEAIITATMPAHFFSVDPNNRLEIDGAKVQENAAANPFAGQLEVAPIPDSVLLADALHDAREGRLHRERHKNLGLGGGVRGLFGSDGEIPKPIEVKPIGAHELGAGILGEGVVGRNIGRPLRLKRPLHRHPGGCHRSHKKS